MASLLQPVFLVLFLLMITSSQAQSTSKPNAVVIPVTKDTKTLQYVTTITQSTPPVPINLVVDLGGHFIWTDCQSSYKSLSRRAARCKSAECTVANTSPHCTNTCKLFTQNGVTEHITGGNVSTDTVTLKSTDGYKLGDAVTVPQFIFSCTSSSLLKGLATGAKGIAGLGRTQIALPSQLAAQLSFERKFAVCLSPSSASPGAIFFGNKPYSFLQDSDVSNSFTYTKLISNPVSTNGWALRNDGSFEYFMGVTAITISGKTLPIDASLLSIAKTGFGGTKFSTVAPYSLLETSIYKAFTKSFIEEAASMNITRVASVAPFGACFDSKSIKNVEGRLDVPDINLVLQSKGVVWPIYPTNSMVQVTDKVMCLAFVDAKSAEHVDGVPRASILLGGYQLENNIVQFDLDASTVGFASMVYDFDTTCSSFKSSV